MTYLYEDSELLDYLRRASKRSDGYVGEKDYRRLKDDNWPAPKTLADRFGSWKEAKEQAGLPARGSSWNKDIITGKEYYKYVKRNNDCVSCGEESPVALDFHHPPETPRSIKRGCDISARAADVIKEEINGCIVVCSNCHRKHHSNSHCLNVNGYQKLNAPEVENARVE